MSLILVSIKDFSFLPTLLYGLYNQVPIFFHSTKKCDMQSIQFVFSVSFFFFFFDN
jgi:hypothetical protein